MTRLQDSVPPAFRVIDPSSGRFVTQAVYVAAKLGIADRLAAGPAAVAQLARDPAVHELALTRVMRLLVAKGVFRSEASGEFARVVAAAGLRLTRSLPTASLVSIIEAVPEGRR